MRYSIAEIIQQANEVRGVHKRAQFLIDNFSNQLWTILDYTFNPDINWIVPYDLPYNESVDDKAALRTRLYTESRKLFYFTNLTPHNLNQAKLDNLFRTLLETIHPDDAKLLLHIIQFRSLPGDKITKKIVEAAFPKLTEIWTVK